ncbi:MAG TPA: tetratricopeptide repeat protein [Bryobacteraceae bacterium]|nr:tetratricopeptide repeat protein [Bryobacteraceae bacterium]
MVSVCVVCAQTPAGATGAPDTDKAGAYYHFAMGRLYAEMAVSDGTQASQSDYIAKAIDNYKQALKLDPTEAMILGELTDLYLQTGHVQDAIDEAEDLLKDNPKNLEARRMLGRIYTRAISNPQNGNVDQSMVDKAIAEYKQIVASDAKDADSWVMLGRLYSVSNQTNNAEDAFNSALQADPNNEDAQTLLAMMYADHGDLQKAIDKLKALTDKDPNERTLAALADVYERNNDYKSAAAALKRASTMAPDDDHLQSDLAFDLLRSNQLDEALPLYEGFADDDPRDPQNFLRIAQIYRAKRDLVKARQALNRAKQLDPNNVDVEVEDVTLLDAEGRTGEAIAQLKTLLDRSARSSYSAPLAAVRATLLERLGMLYRGTEQYADAVTSFQQAADLNKDDAPRLSVLIVETYRLAKDPASAQREAEAALKKYPDDHLMAADLYSGMGKTDEAVAEIRANAKGDVGIEADFQIAELYEKGKRWADEAKTLDAAEKLCTSDDQRVNLNFMRGAMYERTKKYEESEAAFRKVLEIDPKNASTLNYLGYMLADRNVRLDEAHDLIKKALDLDPDNGAYLDSMGWVCFRQGNADQAAQLLVQALDHMGTDPTVHDHLGDVYYKLGKTKEAIAQWQASVKAFQSAGPADDNDPEELARVNKKLESARVKLAKETQPAK